MDNRDENHDNRRISISDSSDGDSIVQDRDAELLETLQQMRMRIQRDMQHRIEINLNRENNNNVPDATSFDVLSRPSGSGTSAFHRVGNIDQYSCTSADDNGNPSRSSQMALVWSDNQGTRKRTTSHYAVLKRLRDANQRLTEQIDREGRGDESSPGLPSLSPRPPRHGTLQSVIINPRAGTASGGGPTPPKVRRLAPHLIHPPVRFVYTAAHLQNLPSSIHNQNLNVEDPAEPTPGPSGVQNTGTALNYESDISDEVDGDNEATTENQIHTKDESQSSDPDLNLVLLGLLECPVCLEHMEPPMAQCRRGHLTCRPCRARMLRCPVCRASFTSVRNRAIEQVAEKLRYPCRHGCGVSVSLRSRSRHESSCESRLYACPLPGCAHLPLAHEDLINHFLDEHSEVLSFGTKGTFNYSKAAPHNWIISAHQQVFHVQFCANGRNNGLFGSVTFIGPKKEASKYIYEITLNGNECSRKLTYSRETHSDLDCKNDSYCQGDTFFLSYENAGSFLKPHRNGDLSFVVSVQPNTNYVEKSSDSA